MVKVLEMKIWGSINDRTLVKDYSLTYSTEIFVAARTVVVRELPICCGCSLNCTRILSLEHLPVSLLVNAIIAMINIAKTFPANRDGDETDYFGGWNGVLSTVSSFIPLALSLPSLTMKRFFEM